ncbi:hypothetical protein [Gemmiger sp. An120]|uniref:hypothetical protein n=1 Tax=Gemmiger sp. An120 TaxID=1965549 RepID=UPI00117B4D79|nr:hypothetical protein [Gemmiger sp. An120]
MKRFDAGDFRVNIRNSRLIPDRNQTGVFLVNRVYILSAVAWERFSVISGALSLCKLVRKKFFGK